MKFIKNFQIFENDQHLSTATVINKKAEDTIVDHEENHDGNTSTAVSNVQTTNKSTYKMNPRPEQGDSHQHVSHLTEIENDSETKVGGVNPREKQGDTHQHLQHSVGNSDVKSTIKQHSRPSQGDIHQKLSHATETEETNVSTYKQNPRPNQGNEFQKLQSFSKFK